MKTSWPSGLRRDVKAVVFIGVGSNPTDVMFWPLFSYGLLYYTFESIVMQLLTMPAYVSSDLFITATLYCLKAVIFPWYYTLILKDYI